MIAERRRIRDSWRGRDCVNECKRESFGGGVCSRDNKIIAIVTLNSNFKQTTVAGRHACNTMRVGNMYTYKTCKPGIKSTDFGNSFNNGHPGMGLVCSQGIRNKSPPLNFGKS